MEISKNIYELIYLVILVYYKDRQRTELFFIPNVSIPCYI